MKADQVIRGVTAACTTVAYAAHAGLNGSGDVLFPWIGSVDPFALTIFALLAFAFPELLDRSPIGPNRESKREKQS